MLDCHRLGLAEPIPRLKLARHVAKSDDLHRRGRVRRIDPCRDRMALVRHHLEQEIERKLCTGLFDSSAVAPAATSPMRSASVLLFGVPRRRPLSSAFPITAVGDPRWSPYQVGL